MMVIPAIDLMDGRVVRLAEGDRSRATVYSDEPEELVERFAAAGASRLHVVDLDGAFAGAPVQPRLIGRMTERAHALGCAVQVGGGVRDDRCARAVLDLGADLVIVGTMAVRAPAAAESLCAVNPGRVIVAVDGRDGSVAIDGWRESSALGVASLAEAAARWGAAAVLHTDVRRDGLGVGPAVAETVAIQRRIHIPVIASGGVSRAEDLKLLREAGIRAVVVGRALYEGTVTLEEALARC